LVDQQEALVEELKPDMIRIVRDQNGNHVIQKIISLVPRMCVPFMMSTFRGQINSLSAHNYGCRVVQRMLEQGTEEEKREVMEEVHACAPQLITDTYGNYVAQHVVEHGSPDDRARVIQLVIDQLIEFSVHKFASNVVEKCVEFGTEEERMIIKTKLIMADSKGNHPLDRVMIDQYGNYVLRKFHSSQQLTQTIPS
jgi:mRNA-binding protein PUF3